MTKTFTLLLATFCALPGILRAADWTAADVFTPRMEPRTFTPAGSTNGTQFLLYLPKAFHANPALRWPLMLYLHGAGERSDNVFGVTWHGPPKLVRLGHDFPFIIAAPLCPPKQWWNDRKLLQLLEHLEKELPVDTNRVYLTGMSMGGSGTWSLGLTHAELFAAIAPICGNVNPAFLKNLPATQVEAIRSLPIWAFHGTKDTIVPIRASERMVAELKAIGSTNVVLTKYPNADHDSWTVTYNNATLYHWLLKHERRH